MIIGLLVREPARPVLVELASRPGRGVPAGERGCCGESLTRERPPDGPRSGSTSREGRHDGSDVIVTPTVGMVRIVKGEEPIDVRTGDPALVLEDEEVSLSDPGSEAAEIIVVAGPASFVGCAAMCGEDRSGMKRWCGRSSPGGGGRQRAGDDPL